VGEGGGVRRRGGRSGVGGGVGGQQLHTATAVCSPLQKD
jgi:hypothetical protein